MNIAREKSIAALAVIAILICLAIAAVSAQNKITTQKAATPADSVRTILFVGNSLTYTNDLPALLTRVGKDSGIIIKTEMLAYPNYALEDHWNDGKLQQIIAATQYDFVIVQQGPSSQDEGRKILLDYGAKIKALCAKHHCRLAFFMVWPAFTNFNNFDAVIKNYSDAAAATNSVLCPVGTDWKKHFSATNDYSYYGPDQFHPSLKGSEAAARVIFQSLFR